jgi:hypothetical protein
VLCSPAAENHVEDAVLPHERIDGGGIEGVATERLIPAWSLLELLL